MLENKGNVGDWVEDTDRGQWHRRRVHLLRRGFLPRFYSSLRTFREVHTDVISRCFPHNSCLHKEEENEISKAYSDQAFCCAFLDRLQQSEYLTCRSTCSDTIPRTSWKQCRRSLWRVEDDYKHTARPRPVRP